jgi:hypothetical protein
LLLVVGLSIAASLVWHEGPRTIAGMLACVGWRFAAAAAIYAVHVVVRASALWRTLLDGHVRFADVLRIRLSGEAVEMLTFTGPFLAEPAKGWLLENRGVTTPAAFAAVITEYLLYTLVASWLMIAAVWLLLERGALPPGMRPAAWLATSFVIAFLAAFAFAAIAGVGLIVPLLRASRALIGRQNAERAARGFRPVEELIIRFLHEHPGRLAEVVAIEDAAHILLIVEIWIVIQALGFSPSWTAAMIVEGGVKFVSIAFAFIPGQVGASEGVYALLAAAIGLPAAAGVALVLVRRIRGLLVAAAGVLALALFDDHSDAKMSVEGGP